MIIVKSKQGLAFGQNLDFQSGIGIGDEALKNGAIREGIGSADRR